MARLKKLDENVKYTDIYDADEFFGSPSVDKKDDNQIIDKNAIKDENFDLGDFILSHNMQTTSLKVRLWPKILALVISFVGLIGVCVLVVFIINSTKTLNGKWQSDDGVVVEIIDKYITINGTSLKYVIEENNVFAININDEYFRIIYKLYGDSLTFIIPSDNPEEVETINYKRC